MNKKKYFLIGCLLLSLLVSTKATSASSFSACQIPDLSKAEIIDCSGVKDLNFTQLSQASKVKRLILKDTDLTSVPAQVFTLTNLEELVLSKNNLKSIPNDIKKLTKLKVLRLDNNSFEKYPSSINNLKNLQTMSLANNSLYTIPQDINKLTNLQSLNLENNSINTLPSLNSLTKLKTLKLNNNLLFKLPSLTSNNLTSLSIDNNLLTVKSIRTKGNTFRVVKQNKLEVISDKYNLKELMFNKNNMIITNTKLTNNKKAIGFKDYLMVNLRDSNGYSVSLSDYIDTKTYQEKKSGKVTADISLVNYANQRYIAKNAMLFNFKTGATNSNNISSANNTVTNATGALMATGLSNRLEELKESNNNEENTLNMPQNSLLVNNFDDYYTIVRFIILSVLILLLLLVPYLVILYLVNKTRKSMVILEEV